MTMRNNTTDWHGICRICDLAETNRCLSCPTRTRAFKKMVAVWHRRHRLVLAYAAVGLTLATALQVAR